MYDDATRRAARGEDPNLRAVVADLFAVLIAFDDKPFYLDRNKWKVTGYRFGRYLSSCVDEARKRKATALLVRDFSDGLVAFCNEEAGLGPPIAFDSERAADIEEKAEKLLALASHPSTGDGERSASERGLRKMFSNGDLSLLSRARHQYLEDRLRQVEDVIRFIKQKHPGIFLW